MYINQNKLSHLLQPRHYRDSAFLEHEKRLIFDSSWHLVGAKGEIPQPGDFFTIDLMGTPLIVKNCDGQVQVFLNVCGHRHCRLTDQKCGNSPTIKCQYHGWEYKASGFTGKIPDAQCFRPFDRENTELKQFPAKVCGQLIFVALSDKAPPFEKYLGKFRERFEDWFSGQDYHFGCRLSYNVNANWKVSNENTLESYHLPEVHRKTIGVHPAEEDQEHEIGDYYSSLYTIEPDSINLQMQDILMAMIGVVTTHRYEHHMIYPNTIFLRLDPVVMTQFHIPTSPTTHRLVGLVFFRSGTHFLGKGIAKFLSDPMIKLGTTRVVGEDIRLYDEVQSGLNVSSYPGVLGTIEERIFAFQEWLLERCEGRPRESTAWQRNLESGRVKLIRTTEG